MDMINPITVARIRTMTCFMREAMRALVISLKSMFLILAIIEEGLLIQKSEELNLISAKMMVKSYIGSLTE